MEEVLARVLRHYALGQPRAAQKIERGFVDENWIVDTDKGRCFVKRHHPIRSQPSVIRAQHALVQRLRRAGFPAPHILTTENDSTFLLLGGRLYEVQDYIQGEPYASEQPQHLEAAAETLGRYHTLVEGFAPRPLRGRKPLYCPDSLDAMLSRMWEGWQIEQDTVLIEIGREMKARAAMMAALFARHGALPQLIIHGDYWAGNLLLWGGRVVGVVDYDKASWQPRVAELAEALIYFASSRPGHLEYVAYPGFLRWEPLARFLQAYTRSADLVEAEIEALPTYVSYIWFLVSLKRLLEGVRTRYSPGLIDRLPMVSLQRPSHAAAALEEVLMLTDWAAANACQMGEVARSAVLERE
jgi:homoserine kinase type II